MQLDRLPKHRLLAAEAEPSAQNATHLRFVRLRRPFDSVASLVPVDTRLIPAERGQKLKLGRKVRRHHDDAALLRAEVDPSQLTDVPARALRVAFVRALFQRLPRPVFLDVRLLPRKAGKAAA